MRDSTTSTPPATKVGKYIANCDKLCLSNSEAQQVYEAVLKDRPVRSDKVSLGQAADPVMDWTASINPYAAAVQGSLDADFLEEPTVALSEADLLWSILSTQVLL